MPNCVHPFVKNPRKKEGQWKTWYEGGELRREKEVKKSPISYVVCKIPTEGLCSIFTRTQRFF